mmetsp:Transcript_37704/g.112887  ORF Transcript_37704/g.112887 Transcript_37704/m.112887 type:complete len:839 (-) Transcript_37704:77-2593(-)
MTTENTLMPLLQRLMDESQSSLKRDERFLVAALILTRQPPSAVENLVKEDQKILSFNFGLVKNYISFTSVQVKENPGLMKEEEAYLALAARFFFKYYDRESETKEDAQPTYLDQHIHDSLLKSVQLRQRFAMPIGIADVDIVKALGRITQGCNWKDWGQVRNSNNILRSHAPHHLLKRCLKDGNQPTNASVKQDETMGTWEQNEPVRCLMVTTINSILAESHAKGNDNSKTDTLRFQYIEALVSYLEAHLGHSLSPSPHDLDLSEHMTIQSVINKTETVVNAQDSLCTDENQILVPEYEREFLLDFFRFVVEFPRLEKTSEGLTQKISTRLNSLALMLIIYLIRSQDRCRRPGQYKLGEALRSCKTRNNKIVDEEMAAAVLNLILHCLLVESSSTRGHQIGSIAGSTSFHLLTFEAIASAVGACDLHWMIYDREMPFEIAAASDLGSTAALCSVIRMVAGNLRLSLGSLLDCSNAIFGSSDSKSDSLQMAVECTHTLNCTLGFILTQADEMDVAACRVLLNSEALLHIRSSIEDAINSVVQFLIDPIADNYHRLLFESIGQGQIVSRGGNDVSKASAYDCAAIACCSFLGAYFSEESIFAMSKSTRSAHVASTINIINALRNGLVVCFSVDVREFQLATEPMKEKRCILTETSILQMKFGSGDSFCGRSIVSLLPCLATSFALAEEEGEKAAYLLGTEILKNGLCVSAICFLMNGNLLTVRNKKEPKLAPQILAEYVCCCNVVKGLSQIDQFIGFSSKPCEATILKEKEKAEMRSCLLLWSSFLVEQCKGVEFKSTEDMLALIHTSEALNSLLGASMDPEAISAVEEATELLKKFQCP